MNLLPDTHVLLWALLEPEKLSPALRSALEDSDNTLVVSAASAWEIATKWRLGKLQHAGLWDVPHPGPFDRLLAAQARSDDLLLASTDPAFALFEGVMTLG